MLLWALLSQAVAAPYFGVDYVPFGRQDLAWTDDGQLTGSLVGELDGIVSPGLGAQGGALWDRSALLAGLGVAWVSTAVHDGNSTSRTHAGTLRPSLDYRRYLHDRRAGKAGGFAQVGAYGLVPTAATTSDDYSKEEQDDADTEAKELRTRIGGFGAQAGVGAEITWESGLTVGARYLVVLYRGAAKAADSTTSSLLVYGEAGIIVGFVL